MGIVNVSSTETKWTWLQKRLQAAQAEVDAVAGEIQGLENTLLNEDGSSTCCTGCGVNLHTEADFAKHFIVPDPRYLNWGRCPEVLKQEAAAAQKAKDITHVLDSDGILKSTERSYADVVGPYKDALYPNGM